MGRAGEKQDIGGGKGLPVKDGCTLYNWKYAQIWNCGYYSDW